MVRVGMSLTALGEAPLGKQLSRVNADGRLVDDRQERPRRMGALELVSLRVPAIAELTPALNSSSELPRRRHPPQPDPHPLGLHLRPTPHRPRQAQEAAPRL